MFFLTVYGLIKQYLGVFSIKEESMSVFKFLNSEDYKNMLDTIRHCILSTDLELYFQNKKQLRGLLDCGSFKWAQPDHR